MTTYTIVCGPTASGKSYVAEMIAKKYQSAAIVNADAFQIYKGLEIITASPTKSQKKDIPHFLYNYICYKSSFSVYDYLEDMKTLLYKIKNEFKHIIIVGGTGLYIYALTNGMTDIPESSQENLDYAQDYINLKGLEAFYQYLASLDTMIIGKISKNDSKRLIRAFCIYKQTQKSILLQRNNNNRILNEYRIFFLNPNRELLYKNCNYRLDEMLKNGGLEEINKFSDHKIKYQSFNAIAVSEFLLYHNQKLSYEEALKKAQQRTRNYAKRQITWFKNKINFKQTIEFSNKNELTIAINSLC